MTRLRQIALGGLAALAIGGAASSALAEESGTFQNRLNGATIGLPLGALPPPGLYTGLETVYLGMPSDTGNGGRAAGNQGKRAESRDRPGGTVTVCPGMDVPGRLLRHVGGSGLLCLHVVWAHGVCRLRSDRSGRLCVC
jgi:hypothetical protein